MSDLTCPICRTSYVKMIENDEYRTRNGYSYECAVCGPFFISSTAEAIQRGRDADPRLSAWIRSHEENKQPKPELLSLSVDDITNNLRQFSVLEKQLLLLRAIEHRTVYPGKEVELSPDIDYPLAWAINRNEFDYILDSLEQRSLITRGDIIGICEVKISPHGWDYLDSEAVKPAFADQAFVAMSFDKSLNLVWEEGIKPAIEQAGYKAHRIDKEEHIDRIDAKIISDIKDSLFVVADVTQQKQGVYFEAGYAIGLNRPVIWCVKKDELEKVHFDTRQYNHIVWETPELLKEQLYYRICAVIGKNKMAA